eukprot:3157976-Pleurochrysis_carterae.AAC.1
MLVPQSLCARAAQDHWQCTSPIHEVTAEHWLRRTLRRVHAPLWPGLREHHRSRKVSYASVRARCAAFCACASLRRCWTSRGHVKRRAQSAWLERGDVCQAYARSARHATRAVLRDVRMGGVCVSHRLQEKARVHERWQSGNPCYSVAKVAPPKAGSRA